MKRPYIAAAVSLTAVVVIGAWLLVFRDTPDRNGAIPGTDVMADMPGMPGMSDTDDGTVALTADQVTTFGVTFGTAELRPLDATVRATGIVMVDETRMTLVTSKVGGFIERLHVNATGQAVRRGQVLYDLYSPDLVAAQDELLAAARLQQENNRVPIPGMPSGESSLLRAAERRLQLWDVSDRQVADILRRGSARRNLAFSSPVTGVVLERHVLAGQAIRAGEPLLTIADLGTVWVEADLREADVAQVRVGASAEIEFAGLPGAMRRGTVTFIAPNITGDARTVRARIVVTNRDGRLRPGMYGTVQLSSPSRAVLSVPTAAVVRTGTRSLVFVTVDDGRLAARDVVTGRTMSGFTEIISGLHAGQQVVTSAQYLLESESNLAAIMRSMIGQTGSAEMKGMNDGKVDDGKAAAPGDTGGAMGNMPGMSMPPEN